MPKANRKHFQKDSSSYKGKWRSYQVLDSRINMGAKTAPIMNFLFNSLNNQF